MGAAIAAPQQAWSPEAWDGRRAGADGPTPGIQDGIGPGSALQQSNPAGSFICTAAFLLRDPYTGTYYLSTAGHCLVRDEADPAPYTGAANPDKLDTKVSICVAQCLDNALGVGTYVDLVAKDGYHPVTFAQSGGVGADFGIIELPPEVHADLRPEMPSWGGPTGLATPSDAADFVVHFGHGSYCCPLTGAVASRTPADQARTGVFQDSSGTTWNAFGSSSGGDSGSGVSFGVPGATGLSGGLALGVLTHGSYVANPAASLPIFTGTMLAHGLEMVRAATGLRLELVAAGDPLPSAPTATPPPASSTNITITAPAAGATLSTTDKKAVVRGIAERGGAPPPNGSQVQVAIDDPGFGFQSRIPVVGNTTWSATWDFAGVPVGKHTVRARIVDAAGAVIDWHNVTVTLQKAPVPSSSASRSATGSSTGGATPAAGSASESQAPFGFVDGKDSPGPALPALALGALAAALVAARRRQ